MVQFDNVDDRYWLRYTGLQDAKHQFLRRYLGGWFPILASGISSRVLYIDCHSGRGRHKTGHVGSPILALDLLLNHNQRDKILANSEVKLVFFEINPDNYKVLESEISTLGSLPSNVIVDLHCEDYEPYIDSIINSLTKRQKQLAPAFAFLDPYGFSLSMDLLNALLSFPRCELLINFMANFIDMSIRNPAQKDNLNSLFGSSEWEYLKGIEPADRREEETIRFFSNQLNAKFVTHLYMIGKNSRLKYALLHATNHPSGRELSKDALWTVAPLGEFKAFERDNPNQIVLIETEPNLKPLEDRLWQEFAGKTVRMKELYHWLLFETYLRKHLHIVLSGYRKNNIVEFSDYGNRFGFRRNPILTFPSKRSK